MATETQEIMAIWEAMTARDAREERFLRQLKANLGLPRNTDICLPVRPGVYPGERTRAALESYVLQMPALALDCLGDRYCLRGAYRAEDICPLRPRQGPTGATDSRRWLRRETAPPATGEESDA